MAHPDDLSPDASPAEVEDTLDRRMFTMPYSSATVDDEDFPELDPAANQLWADDPPEVWQAARRPRAEGIDRHDVLHPLAAVMSERRYFVLARKEPFDPDAYRPALDAPGRDT